MKNNNDFIQRFEWKTEFKPVDWRTKAYSFDPVTNSFRAPIANLDWNLGNRIRAEAIREQQLFPHYDRVRRVVEEYFPGSFTCVNFTKTSSVIYTVKVERLLPFVIFLKYSSFFRCESLMDVWGVDFPSRTKRFEVNYCLLSYKRDERVYLRVFTSELNAIPSLSHLFSSANWLEREVWDMFGVPFSGHPDLRRILTDYGFQGHPLRKDFPVSGYCEVRYDDTSRQVVFEGVKLIQEMRLFFFSNPWKSL